MTNKKLLTIEPETGCLSEENTKRYFSILGFGIFGAVLVQNLVSLLFQFVISPQLIKILPALAENQIFLSLYSNIASIVIIYCTAMPTFMLITSKLPRIRPFREKLRPKQWLSGFCVCWFAMMAGNTISTLLLTAIQAFFGITTTNPVEESINADGIWLTILFACIVAPLLEELFFRKIVCDRLLPLGEGYAVFVSAAIFGLMHQNFYQFAYSFLLGAVLGYVYVKTGKLLYTILYHGIINFMGGVVAPFVLKLVDMEKLEQLIEDFNQNNLDGYDMATLGGLLVGELAVLAYSTFSLVIQIIGMIIFIRMVSRKQITLDEGILPPPKKHKLLNVFCNVGVAAAISIFAVVFVLSLF